MRYFNWWITGVALFFNQSIYSQDLTLKINELIEQQLPHATVGVLVEDLNNGKVIYSRNADKLLTPASSTKLFTAAAALYYLKPDFRFFTTLSQKNQNYYLTFTGSPSFTENNLITLLSNLKKDNVTIIQGNIVIDDTQYTPPYYLNGNSYDDLGWAYTVPDTAVIINGNAETYELVSAKELGALAQINTKTSSKALTVINEVTTVNKAEEKNHCNLNLEIKNNNTVRLFGCAAQEKDPKKLELAIPNPVLFAKQIIQKALNENGITLKGTIINGKTPADAQVIARFQSDNLIKLITHMLQKSDNLYANSVTRTLGYLITGKGSHKEGMFAIKKIISEHTHLDVKQMELNDGEGTRYNLISPQQFVTLLRELYQDKTIQSFLLSALPQAGVSGTLETRMKDTLLDKKVFAKTGSMHDVSSLSGFIINPNGKSFVFSIITNGTIKSQQAKSLEEKILLTINNHFLEKNDLSKAF